MFFKSTEYVGSYVKLDQCPKDGKAEYAFVGRSNVGKSTLINFITHSKKLAKVSHTPGKTQTINYFLIDKEWYLVDLPGYGYAKVSKKLRANWEKMIHSYLAKRETLVCLFLLIDSRIPPQKIDLEFMEWLGENRVPFVIVFTKADKYPSNKISGNIQSFKSQMLKKWESLPQILITSAQSKMGREEILEFIEETKEG